jgi:pimeloyl-ACP methyl ester carboxylesterase
MSSSGARGLPGPQPQVLKVLLSRPRDRSEPAVVDHYVRVFRAIGSPAFPTPENELRERIRQSIRRSYRPAGSTRQIAAVAADTRRAQELPGIRARTLVLHGGNDPLAPVACGVDTARRIPGARFEAIAGMGHDLPPPVVERLLKPLLPFLALA